MTPDLGAMSQPAVMDPDISATLSDFLTYTEHLPSAVIRSMTLIETLNQKATMLQKQIHDQLTIYATLPTLPTPAPPQEAPDATRMRRDISRAYNKLEECKRMSAAEAARIEDMVTRDGRRLEVVSQKLNALPMPPSRDATPEAVLSSPQLKRGAQAHTQAQQSADKRLAAHRTTTAPRVRNKDKLMVPGEVLPPPNPDSPPPSEPDDWLSPAPPTISRSSQNPPPSRQKSVARQRTPKAPRQPKPEKEKLQKTPRSRPPGIPGTNAHSAVAGISTSNAIMALTKPPADALVGSKWLPWKMLTEYELAKLRKRMKKNAAWRPSPAMRNRELKECGRGAQAMEEAEAEAAAKGLPFLNEYDPETWIDPTMTTVSGEQQAEMNAILGPEKDQPDADDTLINRGMRLNEAKKLKRERQKAEESALETSMPDMPVKPVTGATTYSQPQQTEVQKPVKSSGQTAKQSTKANDAQAEPANKSLPEPSHVQTEPATDTVSTTKHDLAKISFPTSDPSVATATSKPNGQSKPSITAPQVSADAPTKKRKRGPSPVAPDAPNAEAIDAPASAPAVPERKKLKINPPAPPTSDPAVAVPSPKPLTPAEPTPRASTRSRSQRTSVAPDNPTSPPVSVPSTRSAKPSGPTITIKRPKAASAEPPNQRALRRASNASLPGDDGGTTQSPAPPKKEQTPRRSVEPGAARRKRRPAPGVVAAETDGSAMVSIGKRKKPPAKKQAQQPQQGKGANGGSKKDDLTAATTPVLPEEEIDPNEERYCICGDVSWGPMICCDNSPHVSILFSAFGFSPIVVCLKRG